MIWWWLRGPGVRGKRLAALAGLGGAGLDFLEGREGAVVGAVGGVDAALEAVEILAAGVADLGHLETFGRVVEAFEVVPPDLRFEGAEAALEPLGGDEGIDQGADFGSGGLVAVVVFGDEEREGRGVFAGDDLGLGVDAGFQGIEADCVLALSGGWTSGFLRVEPVGLDLFWS